MRFIRSFSTTRAVATKYGFIGLGRMGLPMAQNLRTKLPESDELTLFDVNTEAPKAIKGPNINIASSVGEVAHKSDVVITMLPEPSHVSSVYQSLADHLSNHHPASEPKLFIDSSTIDIETSLKVSTLLKDRGLGQFVDAPVSGGVVGATNATLTFMIGSNEQDTLYQNEVSPILKHMGGRLVPCGAPGTGLAAKLANNYILALNNLAAAEGFQLAKRLGLDLELFSKIVNSSSGRSWSSEVNNPVPNIESSKNAPSSRDYNGGFGIALMRKDLGLAIDASKVAALDLPLSELAYNIYKTVEKEEAYKTKDMAIVYKWLDE